MSGCKAGVKTALQICNSRVLLTMKTGLEAVWHSENQYFLLQSTFKK